MVQGFIDYNIICCLHSLTYHVRFNKVLNANALLSLNNHVNMNFNMKTLKKKNINFNMIFS